MRISGTKYWIYSMIILGSGLGLGSLLYPHPLSWIPFAVSIFSFQVFTMIIFSDKKIEEKDAKQ